MKIPFELAMERLSKSSPTTKLTEQHKKEIAELKSIYKANVADREIFVKGEIAKAVDKGHVGAIEPLEKQLTRAASKKQFPISGQLSRRGLLTNEPGGKGGIVRKLTLIALPAAAAALLVAAGARAETVVLSKRLGNNTEALTPFKSGSIVAMDGNDVFRIKVRGGGDDDNQETGDNQTSDEQAAKRLLEVDALGPEVN